MSKRSADDSLEQVDGKPRKQNKKRASRPVHGGWIISEGVGGRILEVDPIFSQDGQVILIAYSTSIRAYSTKTSLLVRGFDVDSGIVTGMAASSVPGSGDLFVSTDGGSIIKWNWETGSKINSYSLGRPIRTVVYGLDLSGEDSDAILALEDCETQPAHDEYATSSPEQQITVHCLSRSTSSVTSRAIRKIQPLRTLQAFNRGKLVVASSGRNILVGRLHGDISQSRIEDLSYRWYELTTSNEITCVDVRLQRSSKSTNADIAVGTVTGAIYIYFNLVTTLRNAEKKSGSVKPSEQKLHWHRFPVKTVRFSRDGNYLLSGGLESVLCNWQLDTGKRQDIPHLTAAIVNLELSPDGASYAVTLANNSLVILSSLDLQVTFRASGPAWPVSAFGRSKKPSYPALVKPGSVPTQILLAVPSSDRQGEDSISSAVYLQTIDSRTGEQLEKQALTRNNATDRMCDSSGRPIREPDISHLAISEDGKWLATVESWKPYSQDLAIASTRLEGETLANERAEVFLKFWKRNDGNKTWELSARIDDPHGRHSFEPGDILDITASSEGFVTIGSDGEIRTWKQKYRRRNNLQVKDQEGNALTNWQCISSISTPPRPVVDEFESVLLLAKLTTSQDGSSLAVFLQFQSSTTLCVVDCHDNSVIWARNDLLTKAVHGLCIVDKYLVILSENLLVWDLVADELHFSYALKCSRLPPSHVHGFSYLAHNSSDQFAVAVPNKNGDATQVAIFDASFSKPISLHEITQPLQFLCSLPSSKGFLFIDGQTQVHELAAPSVMRSTSSTVEIDESDLAV